jgi:hypothetical protein
MIREALGNSFLNPLTWDEKSYFFHSLATDNNISMIIEFLLI